MSFTRLSAELYKQLCDRVLNRDGWKCRHCAVRNNLHIHHIIFRSHGGVDALWNLLTLCSACHDAVHRSDLTLVPFEFQQPPYDANFKLKFERRNGWRPRMLT
jgi:5-methylcytosine-specific restriction endonuclease McrA